MQPARLEGESTRVADSGIDLSMLLFMLFIELESEIARADHKAELALGVDALLIIAIAVFAPALDGLSAASRTALLALRAITVIALLVSVYFALGVAAPRFRSGRHTEGSTHQPTLFYVGYITTLGPDGYVDEFMRLTLNGAVRMVMMGIHSKASIVRIKFSGVRTSMLASGLALALWMLAAALTGILH